MLILIGVAHTYLGERYILVRLFRRDNLPHLFGGEEFTKNTLRFAWHLTSLAWFGFAAILICLANTNVSLVVVGNIIGVTFLLHSFLSLVIAKARHFSWYVFLAIGVITIYAANL